LAAAAVAPGRAADLTAGRRFLRGRLARSAAACYRCAVPEAPAPPPALPRPPAWALAIARGAGRIELADAVFAAGAALAALDPLARADAPFAGAWRARLALRSAAASLAALGRPDDEAALRDARALTRPGGDPGPAGRVYAAWRGLSRGTLGDLAGALGISGFDAAALASGRAKAAPLAAAAAAAAAKREPLGFALADLALAAALGWPQPLPLLGPELMRLGGHRVRPGEAAWPAACCLAYAGAAATACDLYAELARAAARLQAVAPKLRAKAAPAAVAAILADDAITGAAEIRGLSDRGLRRLLDRLVRLGALRELSGRATFRLYGL
jgi:hypothetical protein